MRGFVDRIEDGVAVILLDGGGRVYLADRYLPGDVGPGSLVEVSVTAAGSMPAEEVADLIEHLRSGGHQHG